MNRIVRIILSALNVILIAETLYFGLPVFWAKVPVLEVSAEEARAMVEKADNVGTLRKLALAGDAGVRAHQELASVFREGAVWISSVALAIGLGNLLAIGFAVRKERARREF